MWSTPNLLIVCVWTVLGRDISAPSTCFLTFRKLGEVENYEIQPKHVYLYKNSAFRALIVNKKKKGKFICKWPGYYLDDVDACFHSSVLQDKITLFQLSKTQALYPYEFEADILENVFGSLIDQVWIKFVFISFVKVFLQRFVSLLGLLGTHFLGIECCFHIEMLLILYAGMRPFNTREISP